MKTKVSWGLRLTALFAAALVFALAVFAASPRLHAMLHSAAHGKSTHRAPTQPESSTNEHRSMEDVDDCVVAVFTQGVLVGTVLFLLSVLAWRIRPSYRRLFSIEVCSTPRDWLPPLCGPPLS